MVMGIVLAIKTDLNIDNQPKITTMKRELIKKDHP